MPATQTKAPQNIWDSLFSAKLIRQDQIEACKSFLANRPQAKISDLVNFLQAEDILTAFQAGYVINGQTGDLVCSAYTLVDVIGKGSFGKVYKAKRHDTGQYFAMKILSERNPGLITRFAERLKELSQFRSRAIVPLVHIFSHHGKTCLVWPFVDQGQYGITLEKLVKDQGKLSAKETALIALQLVNALKSIHGQEMFHGLLKPSNVLVTSKRAVRLLDFGIGFLLSVGRSDSLLDTITHANQIASNLDCSSPETINDSSERTPASDRYSLGCMLYYCLTGQYPFPDPNPVKKMLGHSCEEPTPIRDLQPEVPKVLASIIHKLLRKEPSERFSGTEELVTTLESLRGPTTNSGQAYQQSARAKFLAGQTQRPQPKPQAQPRPQPSVAVSKEPTPTPAPTPVLQAAEPEETPRNFAESPVFWVSLMLASAALGTLGFLLT